jgi:predicted TIM-barrel fold metal-dependent hydrolase
VIAGVVIAVGSAGTLTPFVLGAAMAYGAATATADLANLNAHGQSLNPITNERARMSEISLLGTALGAGAMGSAVRTAAAATRGAASTASLWGTTSTVLGRSAFVTGLAGGADQARYLAVNWDHMSGLERGEAFLNLSMSGIDMMTPAITAKIKARRAMPGVDQTAGGPATGPRSDNPMVQTTDPADTNGTQVIDPPLATVRNPVHKNGDPTGAGTGKTTLAGDGTTTQGGDPIVPVNLKTTGPGQNTAGQPATGTGGHPPKVTAPKVTQPSHQPEVNTLALDLGDTAAQSSQSSSSSGSTGTTNRAGRDTTSDDTANSSASNGAHRRDRSAQAGERHLPSQVEAAYRKTQTSQKKLSTAEQALQKQTRATNDLKNKLTHGSESQSKLEVQASTSRRLALEAEAKAEAAGTGAKKLWREAERLRGKAEKAEEAAVAGRAELKKHVDALAEAEVAHAKATQDTTQARKTLVDDQLALAELATQRANGDVKTAKANAARLRSAAQDADGPSAFALRTRAAAAERRAKSVEAMAESIGTRVHTFGEAADTLNLAHVLAEAQVKALETDTTQTVKDFQAYLDAADPSGALPKGRRVLNVKAAEADKANAGDLLHKANEALRLAKAEFKQAQTQHTARAEEADAAWASHAKDAKRDPKLTENLSDTARQRLLRLAGEARVAERRQAVAEADLNHARAVHRAAVQYKQAASHAAKQVEATQGRVSEGNEHNPVTSRAARALQAMDKKAAKLTEVLDKGPEFVPVSTKLTAPGLEYSDGTGPAYPKLSKDFWPRHDLKLKEGTTDEYEAVAVGPKYLEGGARKFIDRSIMRAYDKLKTRGNAYEILSGKPLREGDFRVDPLVVERATIPGGLERVVADVHAHDRGYDHRAANRGERITAQTLQEDINAGWRPIERYFMAVKPLTALQNNSSNTSRILHGSIPQMSTCGAPHYSGIDAGELTMSNGKRMDVEVAKEYRTIVDNYRVQKQKQLDETLKGNDEAAAAAKAQADKFLLSAARADMSMTGVDPSKVDAAAHARQMLLDHPGVFKFVGELTIKKEMVDVLLADDAGEIGSPSLTKVLELANESGLGVLIHCDWGRHALHPGDHRPVATSSAYEYFEALIDKVAKYKNANIVLAHTGLGRLVRPDTNMDNYVIKPTMTSDGRTIEGGTVRLPVHLIKVMEAADRAGNVRFDISWNDVAEAYLSDPAMRQGLVDFIIANPDKVLFGSDTVKPVNQAAYNQSLTTYLPLLADIGVRNPPALWNLLRGNYETLMGNAGDRVHAWTKQELLKPYGGDISKAPKDLQDELTRMDQVHKDLATERTRIEGEAKQHFDTWINQLYQSAYASEASQRGVLPPELLGAPVADRSVSAEAQANLGAAEHQHWVGDPNGAGTPRGRFDTTPRRIVAGTLASVTMTGAYAAADTTFNFVDGDHQQQVLHATGFEARAAMGLVRGAYSDAVRLSWERIFEEGRVTNKDLDRFMNRIRFNGKALGLPKDRLLMAAKLTEQFRVDYAYLANKPLDKANGYDEVQRFNAIMATVGQYQIGVDRALGMQAASINAMDPRTWTGQLFRVGTGLTYGINVAYSAALLASGDVSGLRAMTTAAFGAGNTLLMANTFAGLGSGFTKANWEARLPFRWSQAIGMSGLGAGGALWTLGDAASFYADPSIRGGMQTGFSALFTYASGRQAVGEWRKTAGLPSTDPGHQSNSGYWLAGATIARVLFMNLPEEDKTTQATSAAWTPPQASGLPDWQVQGLDAESDLSRLLQGGSQMVQLDPRKALRLES